MAVIDQILMSWDGFCVTVCKKTLPQYYIENQTVCKEKETKINQCGS